jgi:hypothetical protein
MSSPAVILSASAVSVQSASQACVEEVLVLVMGEVLVSGPARLMACDGAGLCVPVGYFRLLGFDVG